VQLSKGFSSTSELWGSTATALKDNTLKGSKWFRKLTVALRERELKDLVWERPWEVVANRKEIGVQFSQFCFHVHLNLPRGNSADEIKEKQPFGIYPFLLHNHPNFSRYLFSFILSNWRWIDRGQCAQYPRECSECHVYNSSFHVLFECVLFEQARERFYCNAGVPFNFDALKSDDRVVARNAAKCGKEIFERMSTLLVGAY
jgi:hypothetical protein